MRLLDEGYKMLNMFVQFLDCAQLFFLWVNLLLFRSDVVMRKIKRSLSWSGSFALLR
jgi:hypothetical protein